MVHPVLSGQVDTRRSFEVFLREFGCGWAFSVSRHRVTSQAQYTRGVTLSKARPFDLAWARSAIVQCRAAGVPVFCKQLGAKPISNDSADRGHAGMHPYQSVPLRDRKGGDWSEWPADLRVREFPAGSGARRRGRGR